MDEALKAAVADAGRCAEALAAVAAVYAALGEEIDRRRPACDRSGRCCRFEEYGHRLYVTTVELAAFARGLDKTPADVATPNRRLLPVLAAGPWDGTGCPFQADNLCGVHAIRPFGCRIYFCDPTARQWQNEAYERFHAQLKQIHDRFGVPYFYVEWRQALSALGITGPAGARLSPERDSF